MEITDNTAVEKKKKRLIKLLRQVKNTDLLNTIEELLTNEKKDWWFSISESEKNAINEGIEDVKAGRLISHEMVLKETRERYGKQ